MATCFVIQPFDRGKFDKRYQDIYRPAIEDADLEAYRVDEDPKVSVPIDAIEAGIKQAAICLADITTNNPNVWYELGYAFAMGRPVVMVYSKERTEEKFPFDIQHRTIITYSPESQRDFEDLKKQITKRLRALIEQGAALRNIAESDPIAPIEGLSQTEILVLAIIAGSGFLPETAVSAYSIKRDAEATGLTNMGFNLAVRRLRSKEFIEIADLYDDNSNEPYPGIKIIDAGWAWIEKNESLFALHRPETEVSPDDDDLPF